MSNNDSSGSILHFNSNRHEIKGWVVGGGEVVPIHTNRREQREA